MLTENVGHNPYAGKVYVGTCDTCKTYWQQVVIPQEMIIDKKMSLGDIEYEILGRLHKSGWGTIHNLKEPHHITCPHCADKAQGNIKATCDKCGFVQYFMVLTAYHFDTLAGYDPFLWDHAIALAMKKAGWSNWLGSEQDLCPTCNSAGLNQLFIKGFAVTKEMMEKTFFGIDFGKVESHSISAWAKMYNSPVKSKSKT